MSHGLFIDESTGIPWNPVSNAPSYLSTLYGASPTAKFPEKLAYPDDRGEEQGGYDAYADDHIPAAYGGACAPTMRNVGQTGTLREKRENRTLASPAERFREDGARAKVENGEKHQRRKYQNLAGESVISEPVALSDGEKKVHARDLAGGPRARNCAAVKKGSVPRTGDGKEQTRVHKKPKVAVHNYSESSGTESSRASRSATGSTSRKKVGGRTRRTGGRSKEGDRSDGREDRNGVGERRADGTADRHRDKKENFRNDGSWAAGAENDDAAGRSVDWSRQQRRLSHAPTAHWKHGPDNCSSCVHCGALDEPPWTRALEYLVGTFTEKCSKRVLLHREAAHYYDRKLRYLAVPAAVLGAIGACSVFSVWKGELCNSPLNQYTLIFSGVCMILSTALGALVGKSQYPALYSAHLKTYRNFDSLLKRLTVEINFDRSWRAPARDFINEICKEYDRYTDEAELVPRPVEKKVREMLQRAQASVLMERGTGGSGRAHEAGGEIDGERRVIGRNERRSADGSGGGGGFIGGGGVAFKAAQDVFNHPGPLKSAPSGGRWSGTDSFPGVTAAGGAGPGFPGYAQAPIIEGDPSPPPGSFVWKSQTRGVSSLPRTDLNANAENCVQRRFVQPGAELTDAEAAVEKERFSSLVANGKTGADDGGCGVGSGKSGIGDNPYARMLPLEARAEKENKEVKEDLKGEMRLWKVAQRVLRKTNRRSEDVQERVVNQREERDGTARASFYAKEMHEIGQKEKGRELFEGGDQCIIENAFSDGTLKNARQQHPQFRQTFQHLDEQQQQQQQQQQQPEQPEQSQKEQQRRFSRMIGRQRAVMMCEGMPMSSVIEISAPQKFELEENVRDNGDDVVVFANNRAENGRKGSSSGDLGCEPDVYFDARRDDIILVPERDGEGEIVPSSNHSKQNDPFGALSGVNRRESASVGRKSGSNPTNGTGQGDELETYRTCTNERAAETNVNAATVRFVGPGFEQRGTCIDETQKDSWSGRREPSHSNRRLKQKRRSSRVHFLPPLLPGEHQNSPSAVPLVSLSPFRTSEHPEAHSVPSVNAKLVKKESKKKDACASEDSPSVFRDSVALSEYPGRSDGEFSRKKTECGDIKCVLDGRRVQEGGKIPPLRPESDTVEAYLWHTECDSSEFESMPRANNNDNYKSNNNENRRDDDCDENDYDHVENNDTERSIRLERRRKHQNFVNLVREKGMAGTTRSSRNSEDGSGEIHS